MVITRKHFALNYSGCHAHLPPPLCYVTPAENRAPAQGGLLRAGAVGVGLPPEKIMMDPTDPSTWRRPYWFDAQPVIGNPPSFA